MTKSKTTKIQENGNLGETRSAALLAERFWVLRRTVDVDGADFLIQLDDPTVRFTDPMPPRLGVVQSKFSQDEKTSHHIPVDYVIDRRTGHSLVGFFLLIHVGRGRAKKRFLLTAQQIADDLSLNADHTEFYVGAKAYDAKFRADDDETVLDFMENVLVARTQEDAKRLLFSVQIPEYPLKRSNLNNEWLAPIPNEFAFLPDLLYRVKYSLRGVLDSLASLFESIGELLIEKDVDKCLEYIDVVKSDSIVRRQDGGFRIDDLGELNLGGEVLLQAVEVHKRRLGMLMACPEKWESYAQLGASIRDVCWAQFKELEPKKMTIPGGWRFVPYVCELCIELESDSYNAKAVCMRIDPAAPATQGVKRIIISRNIFTSVEGNMVEAVRDMHQVIHLAMVEHFKLMFPSENVGNVRLPQFLME